MQKHFIPLVIVALLVSVLPDVTHAQSAKEAFRALEKLEARCHKGMLYQNYRSGLGDARFEVNRFLESPQAAENNEITDSIRKVMSHYDFANDVWFADIRMKAMRSYLGPKGEPGQEALGRYPMASKNYKEGGALSGPRENVILVEYLLPIIWNEASEELKGTEARLLEMAAGL